MKRKKINLFFFIGLFILLMGCSDTEQVKLDIYQYLNTDVKPIISIHNEAISKYNSYMQGDSNDADALVISLEESVIPAMEEAQTLLAALSYESDQVSDFVKQYQSVIEQEKAAMETVLNAVKNKDQTVLDEANAAINSAMSAMDQYQTDVRTFAASYGITLVEQETSTVEE